MSGTAGEATRVEQVMALVRERIATPHAQPRRPAHVSARHGGSNGIFQIAVVEAYDRLVAERVIRSRAGSGFYIAAPLAPLSLAQVGATP